MKRFKKGTKFSTKPLYGSEYEYHEVSDIEGRCFILNSYTAEGSIRITRYIYDSSFNEHWIPELAQILSKFPWDKYTSDCTCGASHTSFPNSHYPWCKGE